MHRCVNIYLCRYVVDHCKLGRAMVASMTSSYSRSTYADKTTNRDLSLCACNMDV